MPLAITISMLPPANGLKAKIDADNGIGAQPAGFLGELIHGIVPGFVQHFLISAAATAEKIMQAAHDIFQEVGPADHLRADHAQVLLDGSALDAVSGGM